MDTRERVGRAIHAVIVPPAERIGNRPWEACGQEWQERCMTIADAAIAAMRNRTHPEHPTDCECINCWQEGEYSPLLAD